MVPGASVASRVSCLQPRRSDSGPGSLPVLHLRGFSPSRPPPIASSNLPARFFVCGSVPGPVPGPGPGSGSGSGSGSLPALLAIRLFRSPFAKLLAVPPSVRSALCPLCSPAFPASDHSDLRFFFCLARLFFLLPHPDSVFKPDGHFRPAFFSPTVLLAAFQAPFFKHSYIPYIYKERMPFPYTSGNGSVSLI